MPLLLAVLALTIARAAAGADSAAADEALLMRISSENGAAHFQTRTLRRFADLVSSRSGGALIVEFYSDARLFRDADVLAALSRGDVEMALPGIWQFDASVPDTAALMLPSVYARPIPVMRRLVDGELGKAIAAKLSGSLGIHVLGRWLDLGYAQLFSAAPIGGFDELRGLTVRVAGGRGNEERMRVFGAKPVSIPSPDLPAYLDRGLVGAVLSTYETIDSAGLDAHGLRAALEDEEYYPFYLPLVSASFWERLSPRLRSILVDTWEELLPAAREESVKAQDAARRDLLARGLRITVPAPDRIAAARRLLLAREEEIAQRLGVSTPVLDLLHAGLGSPAK